ncbi:hypothetical protein [Silvimonas amylolytica]|uniref:Secreted protein n=1 Tax=Silvimonas amylolytica TaxID=449663 RepID=A0ABQ2PG49_9NEIS|nr:hypothetical protein [Silvimonas amylolytica]GGP24356.1 hypothetical protein GCM10010971_01750 [Silvimonas amylolytica]
MIITLCMSAATLLAGTALATDNSSVTSHHDYNSDNNANISSPAGTNVQDLNSTDAPNMDSATPGEQSRAQAHGS